MASTTSLFPASGGPTMGTTSNTGASFRPFNRWQGWFCRAMAGESPPPYTHREVAPLKATYTASPMSHLPGPEKGCALGVRIWRPHRQTENLEGGGGGSSFS